MHKRGPVYIETFSTENPNVSLRMCENGENAHENAWNFFTLKTLSKMETFGKLNL